MFFFLWCLVVLYLLGAGDFLFCWRYRVTLEKGGIGLCGWMESRTPEEGGIGPGGTPSGDTTRAP